MRASTIDFSGERGARWRLLAIAVAILSLLASPLTATADHGGSPNLTVSPNTGLSDSGAVTVTVTGTGYPAGSSVQLQQIHLINGQSSRGYVLNDGFDVLIDSEGGFSSQVGVRYDLNEPAGSERCETTATDACEVQAFLLNGPPFGIPDTATIVFTPPVPTPTPTLAYTLTVAKAGTGLGIVSSSPTGINCGPSCSAVFDTGTLVTLTATPNASSRFTAWSGAGCTGSAACVVTMAGARVVTATFTSSPVNDPPIAQNQNVTTPEDTAKAIVLQATDANGDALTYQIVTAPAHGALSGTGANRTYTPLANYRGGDTFAFQASDGQAPSNTATVSLTVTPVNDVPIVTAWILTRATEGSRTCYCTFGAWTDPDGQAASSYRATIAWGDGGSSVADVLYNASMGRFEAQDRHTYKRFGTYTIKVTVVDSNGGSGSSTSTTTVADAPIHADDLSGGTGRAGRPWGPFRIGCLNDENPYGTKAEFTASIKWGDGGSNSNLTIKKAGSECPGWDFSVHAPAHTYARAGTYTYRYVVVSVGGSSDSGTGTVKISR